MKLILTDEGEVLKEKHIYYLNWVDNFTNAAQWSFVCAVVIGAFFLIGLIFFLNVYTVALAMTSAVLTVVTGILAALTEIFTRKATNTLNQFYDVQAKHFSANLVSDTTTLDNVENFIENPTNVLD